MTEALTNKLSNYLDLEQKDIQSLRESVQQVEHIEAGQDIIRVDEKPEYVHLIVEGWGCRYKYLEDGKRAIVAYLIPGDVCDIHIAMLDHMDHSVSALTPLKLAYLPREAIERCFRDNHTLARAFFWTSLVEESTMREWFVNATSRPADKRLAHLFCELLMRHWAAKLERRADRFPMPLTQNELADAMGISLVHTNRVLQRLRRDGLVEFEGRTLIVLDWARLKAFADFSPTYLHLQEEKVWAGERSVEALGSSSGR